MARSPGKSGAGVTCLQPSVWGVYSDIYIYVYIYIRIYIYICIYIYKVNNGQFRLMPKRCFEDTTMIRTNFA